MNPDSRKRRIALYMIITSLIFSLFLIAGYIGYSHLKVTKQIIPEEIAKQLTFPVYWPKTSTILSADKASIQYQAASKLFTFTATFSRGTKLTISEQSTPESFNDIPQAYDQLIESLLQYANLESVNGKVFLTKPKELNGGQSAVMNAKGTLMFIKPDENLSNDEWKKLFNNLYIIK